MSTYTNEHLNVDNSTTVLMDGGSVPGTESIDSDYVYTSDEGEHTHTHTHPPPKENNQPPISSTSIPRIVNPNHDDTTSDMDVQMDHLETLETHVDDPSHAHSNIDHVDHIDHVQKNHNIHPTNHPSTNSNSSSNNKNRHHDINLAISDDEESGEVDREYTGQFEGPEKTLEVCFRPATNNYTSHVQAHHHHHHHDAVVPSSSSSTNPSNVKIGLRTLTREDLDKVCKRARCTILSSLSNQYLDAYVLSESSLFVYNYMIVIKTCGTTTLLRCLAILIELARSKLNLTLDWVGYSRKNFNFPDDQRFPHGSFTQELEYLYSHKNLCEKLNGNGYTLGPITDDHWFVFVADKTVRSQMDLDNDRVLNIMMFGIDVDIAELFYYDKYKNKYNMNHETEEEEVKRISFEQTRAAGIDALCPGAMFDPRAFEPCGYSMNAILYKSYYTMHITPEEGSSYASFETNQKLASYTSLINNVVRTFKPKKFVMTLMADEGGLKEINKNGNPLMDQNTGSSKIIVPNTIGKNGMDTKKNIIYKRTNLASITVEDDCVCMMGNWSMEEDPRHDNVRRTRGMTFA